jgi:hypothetical protein
MNRPDDPVHAAKLALCGLSRRVADLDKEANQLGVQLDQLVATQAPTTLSQLGWGTRHTATLLVVTSENFNRFRSEAASAHLGADPTVPISSGLTNRRRLDFAGNRAPSRPLHIIVIVRLRYCHRRPAHLARRLANRPQATWHLKDRPTSRNAPRYNSPANVNADVDPASREAAGAATPNNTAEITTRITPLRSPGAINAV